MTNDDLRALLTDSLRNLIVEEWDLAVLNAFERTIVAHFGRIVARLGHVYGLGSEFSIDNDHTRSYDQPKKAIYAINDTAIEHPIEVDLLIHRRGLYTHNLLAMEAKKKTHPSQRDTAKIQALVREPFNYQAGVLLDFGVRSARLNSFWRPRWVWVEAATTELPLETVFEPDECQALNHEGYDRWEARLRVPGSAEAPVAYWTAD